MKQIYLGFFSLLVFISCDKGNEVGKFKYFVEYSNQKLFKLKKKDTDSVYHQFGNYITSLTPYHFSASINMMQMTNDINPVGENTFILDLISAVGYVPKPQADFSKNQVIEIVPKNYGINLIPGREINLKYFIFSPYYLYQEVELPIQYKDVTINQFNQKYQSNWSDIGEEQYYCDSVKHGNILKIRYTPLISKLHLNPAGSPQMYVFGNTDSTYLFNKEGNIIYNSEDLPIGTQGSSVRFCVMRSHKFQAKMLKIPEKDETLSVHTLISFDSRNLIQVYAGNDNIPYTSDDIFVYAPKYWERIGLTIN